MVARQLEVYHLGNHIGGRCVVVPLVSIGGYDVVGMVCGTELGRQGEGWSTSPTMSPSCFVWMIKGFFYG